MDFTRGASMPKLQVREAAGLPPPSPELVLLRVAMEAYVQTAGRKRAERFLRVVVDTLANEENLSSVLPLRPSADAAELARAREQALAWYRSTLPLFLARLDEM